jgi:DNA-binding SARP family transcriptional activator
MAIGGTSHPRLPFALYATAREAAAPAEVTVRLDQLAQLMAATLSEIESLRRENVDLVRALSATPRLGPRPRQATCEETEKDAPLCFYLFGTFEVRAPDGRSLTQWNSRKARAVLAYLVTDPRRGVPKETLIELFWPDAPPARGANNLSIAVHQIRRWLGEFQPSEERGIRVRQGLYGIENGADCWVDAVEMRRLLDAAGTALRNGDRDTARRQTMAAVELYRGGFLESDPYEEWAMAPRREHAEAFKRALAWLTGDCIAAGDWTSVVQHAGRMLEHDACDEEAHRAVMLAAWRTGKRPQALRQFELCASELRSALGVQPSAATQALYREIKG